VRQELQAFSRDPAHAIISMAPTTLSRRSASLSITRLDVKKRFFPRNKSIHTSDVSFSGSLILNANFPIQHRFIISGIAGQYELPSNITSPRVPAEVLDRIIALALTDSIYYPEGYPPTACSNAPETQIRKFTSIAAFSLASANFRQIALRRWFEELNLTKLSHWLNVQKIFGADSQHHGWVR
jgi:hypothetical protein